MKNSDKPINAIVCSDGFVTGETYIKSDECIGLTKREYFAGLAMQGILANMDIMERERNIDKHISGMAIEFADELLKQLEK